MVKAGVSVGMGAGFLIAPPVPGDHKMIVKAARDHKLWNFTVTVVSSNGLQGWTAW